MGNSTASNILYVAMDILNIENNLYSTVRMYIYIYIIILYYCMYMYICMYYVRI